MSDLSRKDINSDQEEKAQGIELRNQVIFISKTLAELMGTLNHFALSTMDKFQKARKSSKKLFAKTDESIAKTNQFVKESFAKTDESIAKTNQFVKESFAKTDESIAKTNQLVQEMIINSDIRATQAELRFQETERKVAESIEIIRILIEERPAWRERNLKGL